MFCSTVKPTVKPAAQAPIMSAAQPLVNRVAASGLVTLKLDTLAPLASIHAFDLADYLWQGLALRERDFREAIRAYDWDAVLAKVLCVYSSADAIIPQWAYMLVATAAAGRVHEVYVGTPTAYDQQVLAKAAAMLDLEPYRDARVVVKGCSDGRDPGAQAYATIALRLQSVAQSVMYGEPCSTVPIYKRPASPSA